MKFDLKLYNPTVLFLTLFIGNMSLLFIGLFLTMICNSVVYILTSIALFVVASILELIFNEFVFGIFIKPVQLIFNNDRIILLNSKSGNHLDEYKWSEIEAFKFKAGSPKNIQIAFYFCNRKSRELFFHNNNNMYDEINNNESLLSVLLLNINNFNSISDSKIYLRRNFMFTSFGKIVYYIILALFLLSLSINIYFQNFKAIGLTFFTSLSLVLTLATSKKNDQDSYDAISKILK